MNRSVRGVCPPHLEVAVGVLEPDAAPLEVQRDRGGLTVAVLRDVQLGVRVCRAPDSISGLVELLHTNEFDLVALGRILLGNPAWVARAAAGELEQIVDYREAHEEEYS